MNARRDPDLLIKAYLEDGVDELPDRTYDAVRAATEQTRQWVVIGPWREQQMQRFAMFGIAAAAMVLAAVIGLRFLPGNGPDGVGGQPTASPSPAPGTIVDAQGPLTAGTYVAHPFRPPNDSMGFTFTVPSDSWETIGNGEGLAWAGDSEGVGMTFLRVTGINADPCKWQGTDGDVDAGRTVDDLIAALDGEIQGDGQAAPPDKYTMSEPEDVTLGGYSGKKVVLTMPADLKRGGNTQYGCDQLLYTIWDEANAEGFTMYAQGPQNLWTLWILGVGGERVVIQASEFADSAPERVQQLDSIVRSIVISAP